MFFIVCQTGWNCLYKQLIYFVLTLKKKYYMETLSIFKIQILICA